MYNENLLLQFYHQMMMLINYQMDPIEYNSLLPESKIETVF